MVGFAAINTNYKQMIGLIEIYTFEKAIAKVF
jgi:hypothetical protein